MRILVVTGSSGGHIFPALSFLEALIDTHKDIETLLVLPRTNIKKDSKDNRFKTKYVAIVPLRLTADVKNLIAILKFFRGFLESILILVTYRPRIVVGFGSIVCVPMIMCARLFGIKTVLHEQNVIPGRANRFLIRFVNRFAISFERTKEFLGEHAHKAVFTGNPLRKELKRLDKKKALDFFGFKEDRFTVLVTGGSQGSHRINMEFSKAILGIAERSKMHIIHLTGENDYDMVRRIYGDLNLEIKIFDFLNAMEYAYSVSSIALSRAGATTIAELIMFQLPAILIPYPFAYKHQMENAKVLQSQGAALVLKEETLDTEVLQSTLERLMHHPEEVEAMRLGLCRFSTPDANQKLIHTILAFA